jgi:virginiamycin B lyase
MVKLLFGAAAAFSLSLVLAPTGTAQAPSPSASPAVSSASSVDEWTVPWERTRPRDPYADARGRVWFVGQAGNYVAYLDPASGNFKRYEILEGTHPHNLVVAKDGMVWYTGNRNGRLVKLDPETGALTDYMMPDPEVGDPHTMVFDDAGNAWFTAQQSDAVGFMNGKTGQIRIWRTGPRSRPYGMEVAPDGKVWFDLFGTNKIGMIDPDLMEVQTFDLPNERTRPRRIAITPDGTIWYGDYSRGYLGRLDPNTGEVTEYPLPGGQASLPYAMTTDGRGRIWVAETGMRPIRLVAFDPATKTFVETVEVEGGEAPNSIRHMTWDEKSGAIWFGTDRNTIGKLVIARPKATS